MNKYNVFIYLFCLILSNQLCANTQIVHTEVVSPDLGNYHCHSSTIVETTPGQLTIAWKGSQPNSKLSGIWISHFNGCSWSPAELIVQADTSIWGPVLTKLSSGELLLFYRMGPSPRNVCAFIKRSYDNGLHWTPPEILPAGILGPVKSKPILLPDGTIIAGSSCESGELQSSFKATSCWIEVSSDRGNQWQKFGPIEIPGKRFGAIEPAIFFTGNSNEIRMLTRDRSKGYIHTALSKDLGHTWSTLSATSVPNPDSGIDAVDLGHGSILLFYNNSQTERNPLSMALSEDGGGSWSHLIDIETNSGEFPAAIQSTDGLIHLCYAWDDPTMGCKRIKHTTIFISFGAKENY